ncbi:MAG: VIT1/CCC1 family protein [Desulfurococcales archaeon]|nr:VIT1/CCC1 family protein [Desulfurococcales archaeon]
MSILTEQTKIKVREFCIDEYRDHIVYKTLARREKDIDRRKILEKLSEEEYKHYLFWKKVIGGECRARIGTSYLWIVTLSRIILGLTFTLKMLERGEEKTIAEYRGYLSNLGGEERQKLEEIIKDEETHESSLMSQINEAVVRYMSFIVLGLADAIVEITGVHAGFLGVTSSTTVAGIAGLVVGFSAAISMASAAYLQAKHDFEKNPISSALVTGFSYISAVVVLASPYFTTHNMLIAFLVSVSFAITLIATFTFYGSVVFDKKFLREFIESTGLMLGTAFSAYFFGEILGVYFGVRGVFG